MLMLYVCCMYAVCSKGIISSSAFPSSCSLSFLSSFSCLFPFPLFRSFFLKAPTDQISQRKSQNIQKIFQSRLWSPFGLDTSGHMWMAVILAIIVVATDWLLGNPFFLFGVPFMTVGCVSFGAIIKEWCWW